MLCQVICLYIRMSRIQVPFLGLTRNVLQEINPTRNDVHGLQHTLWIVFPHNVRLTYAVTWETVRNSNTLKYKRGHYVTDHLYVWAYNSPGAYTTRVRVLVTFIMLLCNLTGVCNVAHTCIYPYVKVITWLLCFPVFLLIYINSTNHNIGKVLTRASRVRGIHLLRVHRVSCAA